MGKKLTDQQRLFCENYVIEPNASEAARKAGYSPKNVNDKASQLLAQDHIKTEINRLKQEQSQRLAIDADYVLKNIQDIAEDAKSTKDYNQALRAFELMGKHLKLFTDVLESKFELKQMPQVMIGDPSAKDGKPPAVLSFDVGQEPDNLEK